MKLFEYIKGDKIVWGIVFFLSLFSLLAVYSSSGFLAYKYQHGNTEYYVLKHFAILFFGLILMYLTHLVKFTRYSRIAQLLLYISVPLLFLTLILNFNTPMASRWIDLPGTNISFQSSDLAKFALIMFLARILSKRKDLLNADFKTVFKVFMLPIIIICVLIFPANLSTAFMLFFVSFMLMIIAKIPFKYLANLIGIGVAGILLMVALNTVFPRFLPRLGTWTSRV